MKKIFLFLFVFLFVFFTHSFADSLTLTTYYPAPFGMYQEMRVAGKLAVGATDPGSADLYVNGKVGIGTSVPSAALHIEGVGSGANVQIENTSPGGAGNPYLRLINGTTNAMAQISLGQTGGGDENQMRFFSWEDFVFLAQPGGSSPTAEIMRIATNGRVGIGTTNPRRQLDIDSRVELGTETTEAVIVLRGENDQRASIRVSNDGATGNGTKMRFWTTNDAGVAITKMWIDGEGSLRTNHPMYMGNDLCVKASPGLGDCAGSQDDDVDLRFRPTSNKGTFIVGANDGNLSLETWGDSAGTGGTNTREVIVNTYGGDNNYNPGEARFRVDGMTFLNGDLCLKSGSGVGDCHTGIDADVDIRMKPQGGGPGKGASIVASAVDPGNLYLETWGTDSQVNIVSYNGNTGTGIKHDEAKLVVDGKIGIGPAYLGGGLTGSSAKLVVGGSAYKLAGVGSGATWDDWSDARLKNIDGEYQYGLAEIDQINPVRFHYKKDNDLGLSSENERIGVVAQDVEKVIPDAVSQDSVNGYLSFNMDPVLWAMVNAIKELKVENDLLKEKVQDLERIQGQL